MRRILSVLVLLVATRDTWAADKVWIRGSMTQQEASCGQWVRNRTNNPQQITQAQNWILAFLSGSSFATGRDILRRTDDESIFLWMDNYCKANPLSVKEDMAFSPRYRFPYGDWFVGAKLMPSCEAF